MPFDRLFIFLWHLTTNLKKLLIKIERFKKNIIPISKFQILMNVINLKRKIQEKPLSLAVKVDQMVSEVGSELVVELRGPEF